MIEPTETHEQHQNASESQDAAAAEKPQRKRRPRSRKPKKEQAGGEPAVSQPVTEPMPESSGLQTEPHEGADVAPAPARARRRRPRRGKRDRTEHQEGAPETSTADVPETSDSGEYVAEPAVTDAAPSALSAGQGAVPVAGSSKRRRRRRKKRPAGTAAEGEAASALKPAGESDTAADEHDDREDTSAAESGQNEEAPAAGSGKRRRRRGRKGKRPEVAAAAEGQASPEKKPKDRTKRILINARYADEKRVAIVEGERLADFYVETASREHLKGNIYKGVVATLMPGLQAAFIDFGQKKHGFLKYREVMPELFDGKNAEQGLVKGQEILVQVIKDERDTKGASLTTYISIPGRYIVMMPGQKRVGISRKIENREDRDRLKETFHSLKLPPDTGFILRTACGDSLEEELSRDLKYLTKLWDRIKANAKKEKAPALIYKEQDIAMRTVRDYLASDVAEVLIDDAKTFKATQAFLKKIMPWRKVNLTQYTDKSPLFSLYNVEAQISRLAQRIVNLPSRGYLVFDKAEAMTVIDVNSGRSRKEENIEATALTTNLEAAEEVARQLRLRDIGGLVAIDFIDMESSKNRKMVEARMQEAMSTDKASTELAGLSKFCIMELTRERIRPAYSDAISRCCPLCEGIGTVSSDDFVAIGALRELHALAASGDTAAITCRLPVESANVLMNTRRKELSALEQEHGINITILADPATPAGQCIMEPQKAK